MIARLKDLFSRRSEEDSSRRICVAAAALLVEAATLDGHLGPEEESRIQALLRTRFELPAAEALELFAEARAQVADAVEIHGFTKAVKDAFDEAERIQLIEMLWEVAYADGVLHDYEANLVRRVAGLIYVSDHDSGAARKRALARTGLGDGIA